MLPIMPSQYRLVVRTIKSGDRFKRDPAALKQLEVLRKLFRECEKIVVATDAGREGELIFRYVYDYLECRKPFERLWISSMTDRAIREGFENLQPGSKFDLLYQSAKARREADWLVGINASQALTFAADRGNYSLGRVQTPTLSLICRRYLENKAFKSKPYYRIQLVASKDGTPIVALHPDKFEDKTMAESVCAAIPKADGVVVKKITRKEISEESPLLYDLTSLQRDANTRLGMSAEQTAEIAQNLYEKQLISYPRTGCRYISEDVFEHIPDIIGKLKEHPYLKLPIRKLNCTLNRHCVDNTKLTDHHALILTENVPHDLREHEQQIYDMISVRMLESFSERCIKEITTISFVCGGFSFEAKGEVITQAG